MKNAGLAQFFPVIIRWRIFCFLCFGEIRKKIENKEWNLRQDEMCVVDKVNFEALICKSKETIWFGIFKNCTEKCRRANLFGM